MVVWSTAIQQHQFEVSIADVEHQIPSHRPQDHPGGELPTLECQPLNHRHPRTASDPVPIMPQPGQPENFATEPSSVIPSPDLSASNKRP